MDISTLFVSSLSVSPVIFSLILNELVVASASLKSTFPLLAFTAGSSLPCCHKIPHVFEKLSLYSVKLSITTSMSLALSTCVLFVSLMQSVNGAHFLNIVFLLVLFAAAGATDLFATVIVPFISIYSSL